jgi:hypothetical protein
MMDKAVTQEDPAGCGVACVAYLCKTTYRNTLHRHFRRASPSLYGYTCREVMSALAHAGMHYRIRYVRHKRTPSFEDGTIVYTERNTSYPLGHYLVKHGKKRMNPWINFPYMNLPKAGFVGLLPGKAIYAIVPEA